MLWFAEDIAVVAENENLPSILSTKEETLLDELNMKINAKKTKVLVCSRINNIWATFNR